MTDAATGPAPIRRQCTHPIYRSGGTDSCGRRATTALLGSTESGDSLPRCDEHLLAAIAVRTVVSRVIRIDLVEAAFLCRAIDCYKPTGHGGPHGL